MDGEQKFLVTVISLGVSLLSLACIITLLAMWQYRVWVLIGFAALLVALITVFTVVKVRGSFNEQNLRHKRVRYQEELPLDEHGMPYYMPPQAQDFPEQTQTIKDGYVAYSQQWKERG
jgi:hypothetical protein